MVILNRFKFSGVSPQAGQRRRLPPKSGLKNEPQNRRISNRRISKGGFARAAQALAPRVA
jgi:hypothetical protein